MGGKGSGGARVGSGPKPKGAKARALGGNAGKRKPAAVAAPAGPVMAPAGMAADQAAVWSELSPLALEARTLTPQTAGSFADLCRAIVVRDGLLATIQAQGWTYVRTTIDGSGQEHSELRKHPLVSDLRGWEQRVEAGRARFRLAPMGKEIAAAVKETDPFDEFEKA